LITNDKDFGELVFLRRQLVTGVILIRLSSGDAEKVAEAVSSVVRNMGDRLSGQFAVVTDDRVRLRAIR
jgi:predicted nuclease of predicted toxin-antitoxin system